MLARLRSLPSWLAPFALASWAMASCSRPATAVVVAVDSNLIVPSELAVIHVEVGGAACSDATCAHDFELTGQGAVGLPFSFTVTPQGDAGPLALVLRARDASGSDRAVREVSSSFIAGRTLLLRVELDRACLDAAACASGSTCIEGACVSAAIDPTHLVDVVPGTELRFDAGTPSDAATDASDADLAPDGGIDAATDGGTDAGSDAAIDAGSVPRTCADLPAGAASGTYTIDPDGAGGAPAFLDYCETSADGGRWTLIAKVDPRTTNLAFGDPRWTAASTAAAFGTADLSVEDALFPSYWQVPVRELRIVMAPVASPTTTISLVTGFSPDATLLLADAMRTGAVHHLAAMEADWQRLVGGTPPGPAVCEVSGMPAELPAAAPMVRVRIGYVGDATTGCTSPGFWVGVGADGASCQAVGNRAGGGRICGPAGQRHDYPLAAWVFGR